MRIEGPTLKPSALMAEIEAFIELLAAGEYERACELGGPIWTPEAIADSLDAYEFGARVTTTGTTGSKERHWLHLFFRDRSTGFDGDVAVDLFLDGRTSDLSAIFAVRREEDSWVVELTSIHVP
jgi:hypothetical protein